jgi:protein-S-isoprenylcysteine O-methyltransferase Ste14
MSRQLLFFIIVPPLLFAYILYVYWPHPWTPLRLAGLTLLLLGLLFVSIARLQLGHSFSITPQARQLVTHGLYSRIRNPVYLFGHVAVLGLILFFNRPWFLLVFLILIPLQILRARAESRVLQARFGDQYLHYKSQTWF